MNRCVREFSSCEMTHRSFSVLLIGLASVKCLKRLRTLLYYFSSHLVSLKVVLRVFLLYELLSKWTHVFNVILKKDFKGKWGVKKSLPELQMGTFIGTLLVTICNKL